MDIELLETNENTRIVNPAIRDRTLYGSRGGCTRHYVAREGGTEVAFLALDPRPDLYMMVIYEIYVPPEQRGRGIGNAVLLAAENIARRLGFPAARLVPMPLGMPPGKEKDEATARLIRWYERHGYRATPESRFTEWQKTL